MKDTAKHRAGQIDRCSKVYKESKPRPRITTSERSLSQKSYLFNKGLDTDPVTFVSASCKDFGELKLIRAVGPSIP